ncbi:MAG: glutamine--fructose-6-phosphate transaminase (isomerizing) [bacterium]|nr:glutamine--fructose-6-phosphate transaminase (isomerizing) [bacterium]
MCGIVGIVGSETPVTSELISGLKRLEYRGYDSAGIATLVEGKLDKRRALGKIKNLEAVLEKTPLSGFTGIGHTRWATHGTPTTANAHPHSGLGVSIVHNGIIENHALLREELSQKGFSFTSETDTEVVAQLLSYYTQKEKLAPLEATQKTVQRLEGAYALALLFEGHDNTIIAARSGSPLAVGHGKEDDKAMYLGSDAMALAPWTNQITYLEEGDIAVLKRDFLQILNHEGETVTRPVQTSNVVTMDLNKQGYRHFMLKEIFEQGDAIRRTLHHLETESTAFSDLENKIDIKNLSRITIVACGTAFYAGFVAKYWIEQWARVPVEIDIASEFRYRTPPLPKGGLTIVVSQSGETADTLAALSYAKSQGQTCLSIVNVPESSIDREADISLYTQAGPEIGVASTKAFTTQLATLAAFSLKLADARGTLKGKDLEEQWQALKTLPEIVQRTLTLNQSIEEMAHTLVPARDVLYLARGACYPIALEGALKLKEISYIHAEGYAAGEMKHGPIALIDDKVPVVIAAPSDTLLEKTLSNAQEVIAREGKVILISDEKGHKSLPGDNILRIQVPETSSPLITPIVYSIPMQLLAYHTASLKGTDVDQPRNLAKSVTVE